jgi:hypothetical protein
MMVFCAGDFDIIWGNVSKRGGDCLSPAAGASEIAYVTTANEWAPLLRFNRLTIREGQNRRLGYPLACATPSGRHGSASVGVAGPHESIRG